MEDNYDLDLPFIFTNLDTANGFWNLVVSHLQEWSFYYVPPEAYGRPVALGES